MLRCQLSFGDCYRRLDGTCSSPLNSLLGKYTSNQNLIDFKEIRNILRKFSNDPLPPVVFPRNSDQEVYSTEINQKDLNAQGFIPDTVKTNASPPRFLAKEDLDNTGLDKYGRIIDDMDEMERFFIWLNMGFGVLNHRKADASKEADGRR